MKRLLLLLVFAVMALGIMAQSDKAESAFNTYVYNEEYQVYLDLCLDGEGVSVPGQDVFGVVPGYFGAVRDSRKWLITSFKHSGKNSVKLDIVNDYGSEDLTAVLTYNAKAGTYTLKQTGGSRLKIVVDRKWVNSSHMTVWLTYGKEKVMYENGGLLLCISINMRNFVVENTYKDNVR